MTISELKQYIFDKQKIEYILEQIGCHHIAYHSNKGFYSCANFDGDNHNAINVKNNEYLNVVNWTRQKEFNKGSDIITLVQYNKQLSFIEAVKYLHSILGIEYKWQKSKIKKQEKEIDPLYVFKKYKNVQKINVDEIKTIENEILNDYVPLLHINWFREGIMPWTRKKFGLLYSYRQKRIIIPLKFWLTGELLGINSRTTVETPEEFGIKKYFITPSYQKALNVFGLFENYNTIQKAGYVVVYESEKSVLKRDSLLDSTGVALSGKFISEEQVRILIGLNAEIVIALDKDVGVDEVRFVCEKFYHIRPVSYIYDKWDLLNNKDSPADTNNQNYNFLFQNRIKYDVNEHKKYLKSLEKR